MEALSAFQVLVNTLSVSLKGNKYYVSMWQDPFYPYSLLFSNYCIHNYHILFVYIYICSVLYAYFIPYAYGMYRTRMVQFCIPYAYNDAIRADSMARLLECI